MKFNVTLLLLFTISILNAQVSSKEAKKWRADLQDLKQQLTERHVNLFHTVSKDTFELAVTHLDEKIPTLNQAQILVRFAQLVAMIGDGHT